MKKYLYLPKQYELVVGDTFELFYRGIVNAMSIDTYDFEIFYEDKVNRGYGYARKYLFTPSEADIGCHIMHIRLWSNEGDVLDEQTVTIKIVPQLKSPKEERVILLMGASDTAPGVWPAELGRRLIGTGGSPEGLGLKNISFIGTREKNGIKYEGYGGWTFDCYTTENRQNNSMIIKGDFGDKVPTVDQHSFYRDENGVQWKLETIMPNAIKVICESQTKVELSATGGCLTHVSGGVNHSDIIYTSAVFSNSNPFWNSELGCNDFVSYAKKHGKDKIDEIVVTLTWNSYRSSKEEYKDSVRRFIKSVHNDFPDCRITFVGGIFPSRDGFAQNYGIRWPWFPRLAVLRDFDNVKEELVAEDPTHLFFVHLAPQIDPDYNILSDEVAVNARNPQTVSIAVNGLHIPPAGSYQISDAIFRHLSAILK
jgi:hypothetical protein